MSALFVFDNGCDLHVFASARHASGWLEAVDIEDGEYPVAYLHDGTVVELLSSGGRVVLRLTGRRDLTALEGRIAAWRSRVGWPEDGSDPLTFADEILRVERRPRHSPPRPGPPGAPDS